MKITTLTLYTNQLAEQKEFYTKTLGLEIINEKETAVQLRAGKSILEFRASEETVSPYHFAFNIPSNQDDEALAWLKKKVSILKDGRKEVQQFPDWNASAIYFYDADNNVVEFISRKNLGNDSKKKFGPASILEISEIGLADGNIKEIIKTLSEDADLEIYSGDAASFAAVGSETGLFICINNKKKETWFPTKDLAQSTDFEVIVNIDENPYKVKYEEGEVNVFIN